MPLYIQNDILSSLDGAYTSGSIFSSCGFLLVISTSIIVRFYRIDHVTKCNEILVLACYKLSHCIQLIHVHYFQYSIMHILSLLKYMFWFSDDYCSILLYHACPVTFKYGRLLYATSSHDVGSGSQLPNQAQIGS